MQKKDFAFMFKPGDYLRDTQCLSEKAQVAYDRIMCEHMRNICISQQQLNFFTKKLNDDEKDELLMVLDKVEGGYQIEWVVVSVSERIAYRESRARNRLGKTKNTSKSYDSHMEGEGEIISEDDNKGIDIGNGSVNEEADEPKINEKLIAPKMVTAFKQAYPKYPIDYNSDLEACLQIAYKIARLNGWTKESVTNGRLEDTLTQWQQIVTFSKTDKWYSSRSISDFNKEFQRLIQKITSDANSNNTANSTQASGGNYKTAGQNVFAERLRQKATEFNK